MLSLNHVPVVHRKKVSLNLSPFLARDANELKRFSSEFCMKKSPTSTFLWRFAEYSPQIDKFQDIIMIARQWPVKRLAEHLGQPQASAINLTAYTYATLSPGMESCLKHRFAQLEFDKLCKVDVHIFTHNLLETYKDDSSSKKRNW